MFKLPFYQQASADKPPLQANELENYSSIPVLFHMTRWDEWWCICSAAAYGVFYKPSMVIIVVF